ncbi:hypothetical protein A2630_03645 [Candidatus Woesebacteria bacterium RIFCSPHIGHO2_01_FULL_44_10]|uniref:Uncharacterized protein n=1 Tax=Candidatus Woesebacteria bacterium RIFCSPLOWO2_01_FULL_44_14 TaxID=1802525 RepID=A0A1F8C1T0_9BACT|nr:MAG: hypothetical protein A2630_03645 [Candidatus Woesebacteria bacterium RIFCSPHIGHO2_01_FULL_44_10]OGM54910.1 MAG: hypothetical protein A3F62_04465 [Candidatus Woesebacteria bacterium RIFCSPHIGHO2_12_FULL_44_11]OGM70321.1 MAG: hypothetical protein A2975_04610 [Candidatus Woesebacteria bacterium RIFCSPLOWO2_01_FULL_44_14]
MSKLSVGQKRALSDFLNTVAAAFLTIGAITPLFSNFGSWKEISASVLGGLSISLLLLTISLRIMRRIKS